MGRKSFRVWGWAGFFGFRAFGSGRPFRRRFFLVQFRVSRLFDAAGLSSGFVARAGLNG